MAILPTWSGEGSLSSAEVYEVAYGEREGWAALRSLQGDPSLDILRYTESGGDASRGIAPTRTLTGGLAGIPCLVSNLTVEEIQSAGGVTVAGGDRRFELFTDVEVKPKDFIRFPATTGDTWEVREVYYDANIGQTIALCRQAPGSAP